MSEGGPVVTLDGGSLSIEQLHRIATDPASRVACADSAMQQVDRCEAHLRAICEEYLRRVEKLEQTKEPADRERQTAELQQYRIYGVTTGFGEFKNRAIGARDLKLLQQNLLLSHATGVGDNVDPDDPRNFFPADVVRAALALRLNTFLKGRSAVRRIVVDRIVGLLNEGIVPLVPTRGSVGSSGDLCPLAHLFCCLLGRGRFYQVRSTADVTRPRIAAQSCERLPAELRLEELSYKEGIALTNGAAFSTAMLALAVHRAENLALTADIVLAMTLEAVMGRSRAFDGKVHQARGMQGQIDCAANVLTLVGRDPKGHPGALVDQTEDVQDPYSVRCAPAVHGACRDAIALARKTTEIEINAATDNPLFFPGEGDACDKLGSPANRDYEAYSACNFHGEPLALAADFLTIALAEFANISERRTQMLLDSHHNRGLPGNLVPNAGLNSGFMIAQYCAAGLVSENKVLAHPASVDSIPTSANVEDHVAMATHAARKLGTVLGNVEAVLAIELLVAAAALEWRVVVRETGQAPVGADHFRSRVEGRAAEIAKSLGPGPRAAYLHLRSNPIAGRRVGPLWADAELHEDIRRARETIVDGSLVAAVKQAIAGGLRGIRRINYT